MYKLSGHSLTRGTFFLPEAQPMILQERDSSCTLQLSPDGPEIGFNDWILDDDWPEGNYVWRVKSLDDTVTGETRQIGLEHIIRILDDTSLFGEITTADIAGQAGASTVSAKQAVQYILGQQSDWVLGDFEYESVSNPYEFGGETLLDALGSVTETLEDAVWEYDLSVYPFRLHIRHRSGTVSSEMRGDRNLSTLKRSVNRSGMYTRIYPAGKNDLHLDSIYLSKNENVYGRVDKIETDQSKSTKENLQAWAQGLLNRHCEPTVSITISGLELSGETGESLDNLKLNKVCQCPLPEFNTTITERIVKKQWRDRRKEPENVTVNLCNSSADVATIIKQQSRSGGKAAAGQAKQNYLFEANGQHLYYEIFDECGHLHNVLEMTTESLRIGFDNLIESTRSEFLMTSESLRIQFENEIASTRSQFEMTSESLRIQFENDLASTRSELEMTSESLRVQFENELASTRSEFQMTSESLRVSFEAGQSSLRSELQMTAGSLRVSFESGISSARSEFQMSAESLRVEFQTADSSLRSYVNQTASSWEAKVAGVAGSDGKVTAASIALAINGAGESEAHISSDKVYIGTSKSTTVINGKCSLSDVSATYIKGQIETVSLLNVQAIGGTNGSAYCHLNEFKGNYYKVNIPGGGGSVTTNDLCDGVYDLQLVESSGTYTLQKRNIKSSTWTDVGSFSRATSLSGAWSGDGTATSNAYTVTATPQGNTNSVTISERLSGTTQYSNFSAEFGTYSGNNFTRRGFTQGYLVINGNNVDVNSASDGSGTAYARIDCQSIYNAGYDVAKGYIVWPSEIGPSETERTSFGVAVPNDARNGSTTITFTMVKGTASASGGYATLKKGSTAIARISLNDWWTGGYNSGYSNGAPASASLGSHVGTGTTWTVVVKKGDNGTVNCNVDMSNVYTAARSGYYLPSQLDIGGSFDSLGFGNLTIKVAGSGGATLKTMNQKVRAWFVTSSTQGTNHSVLPHGSILKLVYQNPDGNEWTNDSYSWSVADPAENPYTVTMPSGYVFVSATPTSALNGWSPTQLSGIATLVRNNYNTYVCIKFKVDGKQRSFYFPTN